MRIEPGPSQREIGAKRNRPPTAKQLAYLADLGYLGEPPRSRGLASDLIDRLKPG